MGKKRFFDNGKNYGKAVRRHNSSTSAYTEQRNREIEDALAAQRERYAEVQNHEESASITGTKPSIPGFIYDARTDRYYPSSKPPPPAKSELKQAPQLKRPGADRRSHTSISPSQASISCVSSIRNRETCGLRRHTTCGQSLHRLYTQSRASSLTIKPLRAMILVGPFKNLASEMCISVHPRNGVIVGGLGSNIMGLYRKNRPNEELPYYSEPIRAHANQLNANLSHRIRSVEWYPGDLLMSTGTPAFAAVVENDNESHLCILSRRLPFHSGTDIGWNTFVLETSRKSKHRPQQILWDSLDPYNMYYTTEEEVRLRSLRGMRTTTILSTRTENTPRHHTVSQPVTLCKSAFSSAGASNVLYVGMRNGKIYSVDTRENGQSIMNQPTVGAMRFCIDHLACLRDGFSILGMDITGRISVFDTRMSPQTSHSQHKSSKAVGQSATPGFRNNGPYMDIVSDADMAGLDSISRGRRFWVSSDESFLVTATSKSLLAHHTRGSNGDIIADASSSYGRYSSTVMGSASEERESSMSLASWSLSRHGGPSGCHSESQSHSWRLLAYRDIVAPAQTGARIHHHTGGVAADEEMIAFHDVLIGPNNKTDSDHPEIPDNKWGDDDNFFFVASSLSRGMHVDANGGVRSRLFAAEMP